jgi:hypothetical protein
VFVVVVTAVIDHSPTGQKYQEMLELPGSPELLLLFEA